jgi:hypothetical protein
VVGFQSIIRLVLLELTRNIQTAGLLTFTIYMLTEHPEILAKLREEILRIVGPTQRPTFDNFRDMKYLRVSNTVQSLFETLISHLVPSGRPERYVTISSIQAQSTE